MTPIPVKIHSKIAQAFVDRYGTTTDLIARAPGRVNLIGEHTDYNDGFVLPMAIDRAIWIAFQPRKDTRVCLHSLDLEQSAEFDLTSLKKGKGWIEYIKGVGREIQEAGHGLNGWEGVITGDIPIGAGLSSSAALELAAARVFAIVSEIPWNPMEMARLCQRAENQWIGVNCGIMDQMVCAVAKEGHALYLDCRSLEHQAIPIPDSLSIVILDTSTRRGLVTSAYNERRAQCEEAAGLLGLRALRDVKETEIEQSVNKLNGVVQMRARHVITENSRVMLTMQALLKGDVLTAGRLINESHASLRDDFEVSSGPLNQIVEAAAAQAGCLGARMTGAGFGGCAIAFTEKRFAHELVDQTITTYKQKTGLDASAYICEPTEGANICDLNELAVYK